ncbi:MAG: hypothetical protein GXO90_04305 [FCB group bacterium]|nr:hypothetical protein [FCB group bacterium]
MTPIRDISNLQPEIKKLEQKQSSKIIRRETSQTAKSDSAKSSAPIQDKVSISQAGKSLLVQQKTLDSYLQELEQIRTLSDERRTQIKEKIRNGDYDRTDVFKFVSNALIHRSDFSSIKHSTPSGKDLEQITGKSDSGFYNSDEVIDKLTDRLLDSGDL